MPIRRVMASGSATDVPPNFITTPTRDLRSRVGHVGLVGPVGRVSRVGLDLPDLADLFDSKGLAFSYEAFTVHELRVENRCASSAANRVVAERDELVVEHGAAPKTSNGHRHAAVPVRVERRLRAIV